MNPQTVKIAIIGGGPASVCLCLQFLKQAKESNHHFELLIFEKNNHIGHGLPYSADNHKTILNLPKDKMSPLPNEPSLFPAWLEQHASEFDTLFPERRWFGKYLEELAWQVQKQARTSNIDIKFLLGHEVVDIIAEQTGEYRICCAPAHYTVNQVILAIGHMPSQVYPLLRGVPGYIDEPLQQHLQSIPLNESVVIIGSRLTAIDTALKLQSSGHHGPLIMVSRSGLLPTVLGCDIPPYQLKYCTIERLLACTEHGIGTLSFFALKQLFLQELGEVEPLIGHLISFPQSCDDITPYQWITNEIHEAEQGARVWQQILFALYPFASQIWSLLDSSSQQLFMTQYYSLFLNYGASFPLVNAYKIKAMLAAKQLAVLGGVCDIRYHESRYELYFKKRQTLKTRYLINATGPGYNPHGVALLDSLLQRGMLSSHYLGGIQVDRDTLQVLDKAGSKNEALYALGELTKGITFFTTDLNSVAVQSQQLVKTLLSQLQIAKT